MEEEYTHLETNSIKFDEENPRIKMALDKYGKNGNLNAERIHFALKTANSEEGHSASFENLKGSIRAFGGLSQPISVIERDGDRICIDGNTRLAIFKEFLRDNVEGNWETIPASLIKNAEQIDIEKIRVSAHLVGARQWPAYEKARYLNYLYNEEFMGFDEMVALCGGNAREIERQINAFSDMNEFYRDVATDIEFKIDRFSGFVEVQKPGIKESIYESGLEMKDFGEWVKEGKIHRLADVRQLPKVLQDENAKNIFLEGGLNSISQAIEHINHKKINSSDKNTKIQDASITTLSEVLTQKLKSMPSEEYRALRKAEIAGGSNEIKALRDLLEEIKEILEDVRE